MLNMMTLFGKASSSRGALLVPREPESHSAAAIKGTLCGEREIVN